MVQYLKLVEILYLSFSRTDVLNGLYLGNGYQIYSQFAFFRRRFEVNQVGQLCCLLDGPSFGFVKAFRVRVGVYSGSS